MMVGGSEEPDRKCVFSVLCGCPDGEHPLSNRGEVCRAPQLTWMLATKSRYGCQEQRLWVEVLMKILQKPILRGIATGLSQDSQI